MRKRFKASGWGGSDTLIGRSLAEESRKLSFEPVQLSAESVVFRIADFWVVLLVVERVMPTQLTGKLQGPFFGSLAFRSHDSLHPLGLGRIENLIKDSPRMGRKDRVSRLSKTRR